MGPLVKSSTSKTIAEHSSVSLLGHEMSSFTTYSLHDVTPQAQSKNDSGSSPPETSETVSQEKARFSFHRLIPSNLPVGFKEIWPTHAMCSLTGHLRDADLELGGTAEGTRGEGHSPGSQPGFSRAKPSSKFIDKQNVEHYVVKAAAILLCKAAAILHSSAEAL